MTQSAPTARRFRRELATTLITVHSPNRSFRLVRAHLARPNPQVRQEAAERSGDPHSPSQGTKPQLADLNTYVFWLLEPNDPTPRAGSVVGHPTDQTDIGRNARDTGSIIKPRRGRRRAARQPEAERDKRATIIGGTAPPWSGGPRRVGLSVCQSIGWATFPSPRDKPAARHTTQEP